MNMRWTIGTVAVCAANIQRYADLGIPGGLATWWAWFIIIGGIAYIAYAINSAPTAEYMRQYRKAKA